MPALPDARAPSPSVPWLCSAGNSLGLQTQNTEKRLANARRTSARPTGAGLPARLGYFSRLLSAASRANVTLSRDTHRKKEQSGAGVLTPPSLPCTY